MHDLFSPTLRRFLSVGLALSLLLVPLAGLAAWWVITAQHYLSAIADQEFRLARYQQVAATLPTLQTHVEQLKKHLDTQGYWLATMTPALAGADLQQRVSHLLAQQGVQVRSTQVVPEVAEGRVMRIAVVVQMTATMAQWRSALYTFEQHRPLLWVNNITLRRLQDRRWLRTGEREVDNLDIGLEVSGYMPTS